MKKILSAISTKIRPLKSIVKSDAKTIHEQDKFLKLIELERERVHRNDLQFSLLLILMNGKDNSNPRITELIQNLSKRVRKTDQIGWYDDNHLGVLLPNTANAGAKVFAEDIRKYQNNCQITIVFKTISYPNK